MSETRECPDCSGRCLRSTVDQKFEYGQGAESVVLTAFVPVWTCGICSFAFTDGDAEALRTKAVNEHLGKLENGGSDDSHDGDCCSDCGSPICYGGCQSERIFLDDDPMDGWDDDWDEGHYRDPYDDEDDDFEEPFKGDDGCMNCGKRTSDCICDDDDPMMDVDWEDMCLDNIDFDAGDRIKVRYNSLANGRNGGKKRAILARANGHLMLNGCWKRSNRNARKQWERQAHRLEVKKESDSWLRHLSGAKYKSLVEEEIQQVMQTNHEHLLEMGEENCRLAYSRARKEVIQRMRANNESVHKYLKAA